MNVSPINLSMSERHARCPGLSDALNRWTSTFRDGRVVAGRGLRELVARLAMREKRTAQGNIVDTRWHLPLRLLNGKEERIPMFSAHIDWCVGCMKWLLIPNCVVITPLATFYCRWFNVIAGESRQVGGNISSTIYTVLPPAMSF